MKTRLSARPVQRDYQTLSAQLYEDMKYDIITCKLRPGKMIFQSALIERYQARKTHLREALKRLTQEGLVRPIPSRGYLVAPISLKNVRELFDVRKILEMAAVERAAELAIEEQLADLDKLVGESHALNTDESSIRWYMTNLEFHVSIAAISNNQLARILQGVLENLSRAFLIDLSVGSRRSTEVMVKTHMEIVQALRRRDRRLAKDLIIAELKHSLESIEESLVLREMSNELREH